MKTFSKEPGNEKSRIIPCPLCGSRSYRAKWRQPNPFVKCTGCGCVYQNPQPVLDDLIIRYDKEYLEYELENEAGFFNLMKLGLKDINFSAIETQLGKGASFLDVGCATGMLLEDMRKRGWTVHGVEVCEPAARWGIENRKLDIHIGPVETFNPENETFDVVHCSHLIEHLTDPRAYIDKVYELLKKGGYFIITTPNIDGLQAKLFGYKWRSAIHDHMVLFSKKRLISVLADIGFQIVSSKTWGGLASGIKPAILKPFIDSLAKRCGFGDVVIVCCMKK